MDRRTFLRRASQAMLGAAAASATSCGRGPSDAAAVAVGPQPLRLRPPQLDNPRRLRLTEADLRSTSALDLWGEGRDWIIELPAEAAIPKGFDIHGRDQARHIVVIGGEVRPTARIDRRTRRYPDGGLPVYAQRGFSGATGGTFRIRCTERGTPVTAPLRHDASRSEVAEAIERAVGRGSVLAVEGADGPGGPWRIAPADVRLGRVQLDLGGLEGALVELPARNHYGPHSGGIKLKQWRGTAHLEGLYVGGSHCDEGLNVQNPWAGAALQLANVRVDVRAYDYHEDWHHPDALQCYLGPSALRMERCDLICAGSQGMIGQPRQTQTPRALDRLDDWWFRDVMFQTRANRRRDDPRPGSPIYVEDDWPRNNFNSAGWRWDMRRCYASRLGLDRREYGGSDLDYFHHYSRPTPPGLRIGRTPRGGGFCRPELLQCGRGYVAPPRTGAPPPPGQVRLEGERRV